MSGDEAAPRDYMREAREARERDGPRAALIVFDEALTAAGGESGDVTRVWLRAMTMKAGTLSVMQQHEEAARLGEIVLRRRTGVDEERSPGTLRAVRWVLVNAYMALGDDDAGLGAIHDYLTRYDHVGADDRARGRLAEARWHEAEIYARQGREAERTAVLRALTNCLDDSDDRVRSIAARAASLLGGSLAERDGEEALVVFHTLAESLRHKPVATEPALRPRTLANIAKCLANQNEFESALEASSRALDEFGPGEDPETRDVSANLALCRALWLNKVGRRDEGLTTLDELIRTYRSDEGQKIASIVARAMASRIAWLCDTEQRDQAALAADALVNHASGISTDGRRSFISALELAAFDMRAAGELQLAAKLGELHPDGPPSNRRVGGWIRRMRYLLGRGRPGR